MKIKLLTFGVFGDLTGKSCHELTGMKTVTDIETYLKESYPETQKFKYKIAVNTKVVDGSKELSDGDEVAILPPFAGG